MKRMTVLDLLSINQTLHHIDKVALFVGDHCLFADISIDELLLTYPYWEVKEYTENSITLYSKYKPSILDLL